MPDDAVGETVVFFRHFEDVLNIQEPAARHNPTAQIVVASHHKVAHVELVLGLVNLRLDHLVGVVDDGQEHVEQDKEHKEDIGDEIDRA